MGGFRDVVVEHHEESDAFLVAQREPCISIAYDEVKKVSGRSFTVLEPSEVAELEVHGSWVMGVLLCPGDTASSVADWVRAQGVDPRRVWFYLHPETNARDALSEWEEAGLQVHSVWTVKDWREFHKHFGAHWNVQVFEDFG